VLYAVVQFSRWLAGPPLPVLSAHCGPDRATHSPWSPSRTPIPRQELTSRGNLETHILAIPSSQLYRRSRLEEHTSNPGDPPPAPTRRSHRLGIRLSLINFFNPPSRFALRCGHEGWT
jgi:hypothetical protein